MTRSLGRAALVRPALPVLDRASRDGFIVDYLSARGRLRQGTVHSCGRRKRLGKFPFPWSQTGMRTPAELRPDPWPDPALRSARKYVDMLQPEEEEGLFIPPPPFLPRPSTGGASGVFWGSGVLFI